MELAFLATPAIPSYDVQITGGKRCTTDLLAMRSNVVTDMLSSTGPL